MKQPIYTAIIFKADKTAAKYRNITNVQKFKLFVLDRFPNALYINLYNKHTKVFWERIYLQDQETATWNNFLAK